MKRFYCADLFTMMSWKSNTDVGTKSSHCSSISSQIRFELSIEQISSAVKVCWSNFSVLWILRFQSPEISIKCRIAVMLIFLIKEEILLSGEMIKQDLEICSHEKAILVLLVLFWAAATQPWITACFKYPGVTTQRQKPEYTDSMVFKRRSEDTLSLN